MALSLGAVSVETLPDWEQPERRNKERNSQRYFVLIINSPANDSLGAFEPFALISISKSFGIVYQKNEYLHY
jgi:hypothetical protein